MATKFGINPFDGPEKRTITDHKKTDGRRPRYDINSADTVLV